MATTRAERKLPDVLRKRARSTTERQIALDTLIRHLGLETSFGAATTPEPERYRALALALMQAFVPAFRMPPQKERKLEGDFERDWLAAGGSLSLFWPALADPDAFYQAQFVQVIEALRTERSKSRSQVFKWLANEVQKTTPSEASKRLECLPLRYRGRQTAGSLKNAFDKIPPAVRATPSSFLPTAPVPGTENLGFFSSTTLSNDLQVPGLLGSLTEDS